MDRKILSYLQLSPLDSRDLYTLKVDYSWQPSSALRTQKRLTPNGEKTDDECECECVTVHCIWSVDSEAPGLFERTFGPVFAQFCVRSSTSASTVE